MRREGYAENHEETAVGLYAVSVPVRNAATAVLAALTICVPTSRIDPARQKRLTGELRDAGHLLSSAVPWLAAWNSVRAEARQLVPAG